jgi:hypothetical protein
MANLQHVASTVNVAHLELGNFGDPESTPVKGRQQGAMPEIAGRLQQRLHFLAAQDQRQLPFPAGKGNPFDADFPAQRVGIQKP